MNRLNRIIKNSKGLTLIEIMVVLVILAILMSFLTGGLFSSAGQARAHINKAKMDRLKSYISQYQLMYNTFPSSLESLINCTQETGNNCIPITDKESLIDAFGTPFVYQSSGNSFTIKSLGADKREGGSGVDGDMIVQGP